MKIQTRVKGFTLIELMVSVTIFSIIMVMSMGAVLSIIEANKKSRSLKSAMNNLNLIVDTIARNVKFGTNWKCGGGSSCADGTYTQIEFTDSFSAPSASRQVFYKYDSDTGQIGRSLDGGVTFYSITSPEIDIESFSFEVSGAGNIADKKQPLLRIRVSGVAGSRASNQTRFDLQTVVSQRDLEDVEFP